jgi:hypothetical protein
VKDVQIIFVKNAKRISKLAIYVQMIYAKIVIQNVFVGMSIVIFVLYHVISAQEEFVIYALINAYVILLFFVMNA